MTDAGRAFIGDMVAALLDVGAVLPDAARTAEDVLLRCLEKDVNATLDRELERHAAYMKDTAHVIKYRERSLASEERIATALETIAVKLSGKP